MLGKNQNIKIYLYPEEKYGLIFNTQNGFFVRKEFRNSDEPFMSKHGPELIDISITNWCDKGCNFCYKKSNKCGKHMSVETFEMILRQAKEMDVLQIALGGGNPNQHPDFCDMLRLARKGYDIIPSYTTNGRGLSDEVLEYTKKYCGSVAISYYPPYDEVKKNVMLLNDYGIKPNLHFLVDSKSMSDAIQLLEFPPSFIQGVNAIVFLNYKPVGRAKKTEMHANKSDLVPKFFEAIHSFQKKNTTKIGFDRCSVSGIIKYLNIADQFIEPCEAARFSMYIDESGEAYPCSFMIESFEGAEIKQNNLLNIWENQQNFVQVRQLLKSNKADKTVCINGCPLFPEIDY